MRAGYPKKGYVISLLTCTFLSLWAKPFRSAAAAIFGIGGIKGIALTAHGFLKQRSTSNRQLFRFSNWHCIYLSLSKFPVVIPVPSEEVFNGFRPFPILKEYDETSFVTFLNDYA